MQCQRAAIFDVAALWLYRVPYNMPMDRWSEKANRTTLLPGPSEPAISLCTVCALWTLSSVELEALMEALCPKQMDSI